MADLKELEDKKNIMEARIISLELKTMDEPLYVMLDNPKVIKANLLCLDRKAIRPLLEQETERLAAIVAEKQVLREKLTEE